MNTTYSHPQSNRSVLRSNDWLGDRPVRRRQSDVPQQTTRALSGPLSFTQIAVLLSLLATSTSIAFAAVELAPGVTYTARSGHAGTATRDIGAVSDLHAVSLLSAGERFNVPCYLSVYKSDINRSGDDNYANWNPCITTSPNEIVGWANNAGVYVNGIAACTNSSHDRLKGIELFGVTILPDGGFLPFPIPVWFSRTNCQAWHPAVFCPAGQVATKVRIDHTGGDTIVGLSLGCRVVTEQ